VIPAYHLVSLPDHRWSEPGAEHFHGMSRHGHSKGLAALIQLSYAKVTTSVQMTAFKAEM
jgi:hypothetical protein